MSTKIEWTDKTWNPIIGCSKVSPACDNCYAEKMAARLATMPQTADNYGTVVTDRKWNGKTALIYSVLKKAMHWRNPCRVFVGSMTDLFHPSTPREWIDKVFAVMALTPHITYQVLTKRPERMAEYCSNPNNRILHEMERISGERLCCGGFWPLKNVWFGVTVENQECADKRIPTLLNTPAAVRFVSIEPMLGSVDLRILNFHQSVVPSAQDGLLGGERLMRNGEWESSGYGPGLDWVICGGETGPGARSMHPDWACDLLIQCESAGVPFFFKKWGNNKVEEIGGQIVREFPTQNGESVDES